MESGKIERGDGEADTALALPADRRSDTENLFLAHALGPSQFLLKLQLFPQILLSTLSFFLFACLLSSPRLWKTLPGVPAVPWREATCAKSSQSNIFRRPVVAPQYSSQYF